MAQTMATMVVKCMTPKTPNHTKPISKPISLLSIQNNLPKGLITSTSQPNGPTLSIASTALAGSFFSILSSVEPAMAVQQLADIAEASNDNRGLALLLPIIPAIGWVLFNILQPALNQFNRMRSERAVIIGLGLGGLGLLLSSPEASAAEIAQVAEGTDNRGQLLLLVVLPAIGWVLFNILQPALNQLNRMRSR